MKSIIVTLFFFISLSHSQVVTLTIEDECKTSVLNPQDNYDSELFICKHFQ
jgi:hypothetical protein